jgi:hypothetical protein
MVVSGGVPASAGTAFDDMPSDDLDAAPAKPDGPAKRAKRARINDSLKQLEALQS